MHGAPQRLRCEYLDNPLGMDVRRPRLSWWVNDDRPAEIQTAYQILAASTPDLLKLDEGDFWDTGRVESRDTFGIEYDGKPLVSSRRVWWKVRSFDSDGLPSPWSDAAFFEPGLLEPSDWQGRWIGAPLRGSRVSAVPVPLLVRTFDLPGKIRSARLYLAALGHVAVQLNGRRIGSDALVPGWVDYARRAEYLTWDVTEALVPGENHLSVLLADGWYAGDCGTGHRQQYGGQPWLLGQLTVTLADAGTVIFATDRRWRWRQSRVLSADPVGGERCDGWQTGTCWLDGEDDGGAGDGYPVIEAEAESVKELIPTAARLRTESLEREDTGEVLAWEESRVLVGFADPIIGRVRVALEIPAGGIVRVRYGQAIGADGRLREPVTEDVFTAAGLEAAEEFEAVFSQHGFSCRYDSRRP